MAVFGIGAVGLAVVQAAKSVGASRIFAVDINPKKYEAARALGATDCLNPIGATAARQIPVLKVTRSNRVSVT